jgi:hypothetical protein
VNLREPTLDVDDRGEMLERHVSAAVSLDDDGPAVAKLHAPHDTSASADPVHGSGTGPKLIATPAIHVHSCLLAWQGSGLALEDAWGGCADCGSTRKRSFCATSRSDLDEKTLVALIKETAKVASSPEPARRRAAVLGPAGGSRRLAADELAGSTGSSGWARRTRLCLLDERCIELDGTSHLALALVRAPGLDEQEP